MKKIPIIIPSLIIAAVCGTLQLNAQTTQPSTQTTLVEEPLRDRDALINTRPRLGSLEKASKIIGMEIGDSQSQKLGKVRDLAVDLQNGRVLEVIVARGGVLGVDEQSVAVPPDQFTYDTERKRLQLNVEKARFDSAPSFKISDWEASVRPAGVTEVYQYYNSKPYFTGGEQDKNLANPPHLGEVRRASKIIGVSARNLQDEKLGKIENLIVDLPAGRVVELIVASGGFLGLGDELSAVPPQSFRPGVQRDILILETTKDELNRAPHFKSNEWPDMSNANQIETVYRAYKVEPYFSTNAVDNTAQNVRDRADGTLTPLSQGASQADVDTSRRIRKEIMAADGLSVNARNVKIITVDGRVTLRGPVNSDDEKQKISAIAARVAQQSNVDNQLQVKASQLKDTTSEK